MPRALLATTIVFGLAAPAEADGPMVLAGGKMKDPAIYDEIVRLAGRSPLVAIVTAASRKYEVDNGRDETRAFTQAGAKALWVDLTRPDAAQILGDADVIFFGGGDQSLLLSRMRDRPGVIEAVRSAHARGAVIAGTSAGTAVQTSAPMITGNRPSWDPNGGLGLFRYGLLDTHFSQRNREARLVALARATHTPLAFGIDENTALVVEQDQVRVVGRNRVLMYTGAGRGQRLILTPGMTATALR